MEQTKQKRDGSLNDYIGSIVNPIFNKVPQETLSNHTMVGLRPKPSLYNPHNYRLYFTFKKDGFKPWGGMVGVWLGKFKNYGKEFTAVGEGVRITVKKDKVEVINKLSEEQWFYINKEKAKEEIQAILNKIDEKCIQSLKKFIVVYGGSSDFVVINKDNRTNFNLFTKSDNKVMKEKFIDSLPDKLTFETDIVKKVYKKDNVEFKEPIYAINYLENSALKDFSPIIAHSIDKVSLDIANTLKENVNATNSLALNMNTHISVLKNIDKSFRKFNKLLSQKNITRWI